MGEKTRTQTYTHTFRYKIQLTHKFVHYNMSRSTNNASPNHILIKIEEKTCFTIKKEKKRSNKMIKYQPNFIIKLCILIYTDHIYSVVLVHIEAIDVCL